MNKIMVDPTILFFAFRYSLGRQTYAPTMVIQELIEHEHEIPEWKKQRIIDEIRSHELMFGTLGMKCDKESWYNLIRRWEA